VVRGKNRGYDSISQENERLKRELEEANMLIEQKSRDVSVMHTYEARNADCLQSMTKAMRPIAQTLRDFVRITEEEEGVRMQREARELESRVDVLDETLSEVEGKAKRVEQAAGTLQGPRAHSKLHLAVAPTTTTLPPHRVSGPKGRERLGSRPSPDGSLLGSDRPSSEWR
jgi:polyhydroxyalkanoate synthesis regulator phasin